MPVDRDRRPRCGRRRSCAAGAATPLSWSARCSREPASDSIWRPRAAARPRGPRSLFEQLVLPLPATPARAALVHAPNCFLPLLPALPGRGHDPRPGLRGLAAGLRSGDAGQVPRDHAAGGAVGASGSSARRAFTADDVCRRYGVDPAQGAGDPRGAGAAGRGVARRPPRSSGPVPARGRRPARQEEPGGAGRARSSRSRRRRAIPHRLVLAGVDAGEGPRLRALAGRRAAAAHRLRRRRAARRADAAAPSCSCTRACTRASGWCVLEAMARGTPVLAARRHGAARDRRRGGGVLRPGRAGRPGRAPAASGCSATPGGASELARAGRARAARVQLGGDGARDRGRLPRAAVSGAGRWRAIRGPRRRGR